MWIVYLVAGLIVLWKIRNIIKTSINSAEEWSLLLSQQSNIQLRKQANNLKAQLELVDGMPLPSQVVAEFEAKQKK